jgi:4,5:9,10-diseco-3-hydroxy-5,9,17-trioxoandrosta-1(10),2-diene-4-oate hydrolase
MLTMAAPTTTRPHASRPDARREWMDIDWREHQRWITVEGTPVNVIDYGEGPPLVFVHGLGGSWPNWLEQLPHFGRSHRTIAIDLPGFGHSPMPKKKISIKGYAETVDRLLDELGIDSTVLVGNSMGGFIGAELAVSFATRIEKLVLVSAAGITEDYEREGGVTRLLDRKNWPTMEEQSRRRRERISGSPIEGVMDRALRVVGFYSAWVAAHSDSFARRPRLRGLLLNFVVRRPAEIPAALAAEQIRGAGKPGFIDAMNDLLDYRIKDCLHQIACPTLIVWGKNDMLVPLRDASTFEELIPSARKLIYDDTGHMAHLERPERFNEDLDRFLAE